MGVRFETPTTTCFNDKAVVTNTTAAGSMLSKKHLTLACHFCREHFSVEVVDIRWAEGKHNVADAMTKALTTGEFHSHVSKAMTNS